MNTVVSLLTAKQKRFYDMLSVYMKEYGKAPTVSEMRDMMDFSSPRSVTQYLHALEGKGLLKRGRYKRRGITLRDFSEIEDSDTVTLPVIGSAGCDNLDTLSDENYEDYICVSRDLIDQKKKETIVSIKAMGNSMVDAGVNDGDYVLVELTQAVTDNDLVVALIDSFAVIKKIEFANNAVILKPVSSDPQYKPIIMSRSFQIFGKVLDIIRIPQTGELEIVPLYGSN